MEHGMSTTWNILRVSTLRETTVAGNLMMDLGLKTYVPIEIRRRQGKGVVHEFRRPLIPGYVFAGTRGKMPWREIAEAKHVIGWLVTDGSRPARVANYEIERIETLARDHNRVLADTFTFRPGDTVRPTRGPFQSIEVLLRSVRGSTATVEVKMLGSTREAKLKVSDLEKVA
jgi:transcription antitermination factor NusG